MVAGAARRAVDARATVAALESARSGGNQWESVKTVGHECASEESVGSVATGTRRCGVMAHMCQGSRRGAAQALRSATHDIVGAARRAAFASAFHAALMSARSVWQSMGER
jgi:hypothetical protein